MKDFIFSLNATMPVFLLMALGFIFNKIGAIDENFANKLNNFVFNSFKFYRSLGWEICIILFFSNIFFDNYNDDFFKIIEG